MNRRDQIIQLATKLIQERGSSGWSYEDIATVLEIRKASIHYYFPKKKMLILEAARLYIDQVLFSVKSELKLVDHSFEKIKKVANYYRLVALQKNKLCLCTALSLSCYDEDQSLAHLLKDFFKKIHQLLFEVLTKGKEAGDLKEHDPNSAATIILATLQGLLLLSEHGWDENEFDRAVTQVIELLKNV